MEHVKHDSQFSIFSSAWVCSYIFSSKVSYRKNVSIRQQATELSFVPAFKPVSVRNNSCENVFRLQVHFHANSFSLARFSTKTCFETEAPGTSEMACCQLIDHIKSLIEQRRSPRRSISLLPIKFLFLSTRWRTSQVITPGFKFPSHVGLHSAHV